MAVPAPANPTIARVQAAEIADGLDFDVALANTAPRPLGGPPAPPNVTPYHCPPPVLHPGSGPHNAYCADRRFQYGPPHVIPPGADECSSLFNPRPPPLGIALTDFLQKTCTDASHGHAPYRICEYCLRNIRRQPWFNQIQDDVTWPPLAIPNPAIPQPIATWTQFLTYLCRECEIKEHKIWRLRRRSGIPLPNHRRMATPPRNTCTCLWSLHFPRTIGARRRDLCIRHRHEQASTRHYELLIIRQQNDQWLREIGRDRVTGRVIRNVDQRRMRARARTGIFRACRCGADIKFNRNRAFDVLLCMGCEGIVHRLPRPFIAPGVPVQEEISDNTRSQKNLNLELRRPL